MKGKILDYNIQESTGIISGDDGQRYSFSNSEWKSSESPKAKSGICDFTKYIAFASFPSISKSTF